MALARYFAGTAWQWTLRSLKQKINQVKKKLGTYQPE
jgi:hypothetical protein